MIGTFLISEKPAGAGVYYRRLNDDYAGQAIIIITGGGTVSEYILPTMNETLKGGAMVGANLYMTGDSLNAYSYELPTASETIKGGIKIGDHLYMTAETLNVDFSEHNEASAAHPYIQNLIGDEISARISAVASLESALTTEQQNRTAADAAINTRIDNLSFEYTLPTASETLKGGVKIGDNLYMTGDSLNARNYELPVAAFDNLGGVKVNNFEAQNYDDGGLKLVNFNSATFPDSAYDGDMLWLRNYPHIPRYIGEVDFDPLGTDDDGNYNYINPNVNDYLSDETTWHEGDVVKYGGDYYILREADYGADNYAFDKLTVKGLTNPIKEMVTLEGDAGFDFNGMITAETSAGYEYVAVKGNENVTPRLLFDNVILESKFNYSNPFHTVLQVSDGSDDNPFFKLNSLGHVTAQKVEVQTELKSPVKAVFEGTVDFTAAQIQGLPTASESTKGGVKIGAGLAMDGEVLNCTVTSSEYTLPTMSKTQKGGAKVGDGLTMVGDVLNVDLIKAATTSDSGAGMMIVSSPSNNFFCLTLPEEVGEDVVVYSTKSGGLTESFHYYLGDNFIYINENCYVSSMALYYKNVSAITVPYVAGVQVAYIKDQVTYEYLAQDVTLTENTTFNIPAANRGNELLVLIMYFADNFKEMSSDDGIVRVKEVPINNVYRGKCYLQTDGLTQYSIYGGVCSERLEHYTIKDGVITFPQVGGTPDYWLEWGNTSASIAGIKLGKGLTYTDGTINIDLNYLKTALDLVQ